VVEHSPDTDEKAVRLGRGGADQAISWALRGSGRVLYGRRAEAIAIGLCLVLVYVGWVGSDPYRVGLLVLAMAYAFLGFGVYVPLIMGGRLAVCYNAYFSAGAYSIGILAAKSSLPVLVAIPIGIGVAVAVASVVSLVCRGLGSYHLAVATLAVAEVADRVLIDWSGTTGGSVGLGGIPKPSLLGHAVELHGLVIGALVLVWCVGVAVNRLRDSVWGLAVRLQREAPIAAEASGASVESLRFVAVGIGAAIASLAGMVLAFANSFIIPESFGFEIVFIIIFIPIMGGAATAWGCVVGAAIIIWLENTSSFGGLSGGFVFGLGVLAVLIAAPGGVLGLVYGVPTFVWRKLRRSSDVRLGHG
jgi:branched-chain amino acid transport system permease protein